MFDIAIMTLIMIYFITSFIIFKQSKKLLGYGSGVSTMLGLLLPSTIFLEILINVSFTVTRFLYNTLMVLVLILCGTDQKEFIKKLKVSGIIE